jgi:hypothetical protein
MSLIPILNGGAQAIDDNEEAAKRLGITMSGATAKGLADVHDTYVEMKASGEGLALTIGTALAPAFKDFALRVTDATVKIKDVAAAHPTAIKSAGDLGLKVGGVLVVLGGLGAVVPKIISGLMLFTNPVVAVTTAIGLLTIRTVEAIGAGNKWAATAEKAAEATGTHATFWQKLEMWAQGAGDTLTMTGKIADRELAQINEHINKTTNSFEAATQAFIDQTGAAKAVVDRLKEIKDGFKNSTEKLDSWDEELKKYGIPNAQEYSAKLQGMKDDQKNWAEMLAKGFATQDQYNEFLKKNKDEMDKLTGATKASRDILKELGVTTRDEVTKKISDATEALIKFRDKLPAGEVEKLKDDIDKWSASLDDNSIAQNKLNDNLGFIKGTLDLMPAALDDVAYAVVDTSASFKEWLITGKIGLETLYLESMPDVAIEIAHLAGQYGVSSKEMVGALFSVQAALLAIAGIDIPDPFANLPDQAQAAAKDTQAPFDTLWSNIAKGFGDTFKAWAEGSLTFSKFLTGLWGDMKTAFFDFVGSLVTQWVEKFLKEAIINQTATAAATAGASMTTMGGAVASVATTIGAVITTLAAAIGAAVVTIATSIASALVIMATAIATAATTLAAAAPAIIIVGAIAAGLYAVGAAVKSLLGGASKQTDVTYWLKPISEYTHDTLDILRLNINGILHDTYNKLSDWNTAITDGYNRLTEIAHYAPWLPKIYQTLLSIDAKTGHAQAGAVVTQPSLMAVGEDAPAVKEYIMTEPQFAGALRAAAAGGGGRGSIHLHFESGEVVLALEETVKKYMVKWLPVLTKREAVMIHPVSVRAF